MLKNFEELQETICSCTECFKSRIGGTNGKRLLVFCGDTGCVSAHSLEIRDKFQKLLAEKGIEDQFEIDKAGCFGFCSQGPFVKIYPENTLYRMVTLDDVEEIIEKDLIGHQIVTRLLYTDPKTGEKIRKQEEIEFYAKQKRIALHGCGVINPEHIEDALANGGFAGLMHALSMTPQEVLDEMLKANLRGRGGAGFPAGKKWAAAAKINDDEKYIVCNGDEGDPGAFMDRSILEGNPYAVIEGLMIGAYAIGAREGYFYIRAEYPVAVKRIRNAIVQMKELGLLGENILGTGFSFDAHVRLGAGAFVCGEASALMNSIEGKRGMPRTKPPRMAQVGLWGKPTVLNNVETLACVPFIMREGADAFLEVGTEKSSGTKVFALGGKVNNVGLVEVAMGTTLRELIFDIGGGIQNDKKFKAIQTGGPSGGCLTEEDLDVAIDFDTLVARGSMMGSGGAIVMDEDNCMVDVAKFYMQFICDESCGKCAPCRIGTTRMYEALKKITDGTAEMEDLEELEELAMIVKRNSLCELGKSASNPVISTMKRFRDEYIAHVKYKKCPANVCKNLFFYKINRDACAGCGLCAKNCPTDAIFRTDYTAPGRKLAAFQIDTGKCTKCGTCRENCKFHAVIKE